MRYTMAYIALLFMGASYNGSTGVSKTSCVSSILAAPAEKTTTKLGFGGREEGVSVYGVVLIPKT